MARTIQGKRHSWQLEDTPIGSGDAGEVFNAVCTDAPDIQGVVKKPARVATGGTIQRQVGQIAQEAQALIRLDGLPDGKAHPPRLLDEAPEFTKGTANYFIVSESAPGEALDAMLSQTRQEGKPFPHRVIVTVLDALFDLFSRAHHAGVLWNDVKLDHVYWHNPSGRVTVIDWGNALFLGQPELSSRPTPPRWEDYRQFVETLGTFLQSSAPDLYTDLGWEEFTGADLDLPTISILARRIAYQQEVIALKVMEYQSLINVVLSAEPDLVGLQDILNYQKILAKIGAPWPRQEVLAYGRNLVQTLSSEGDIQASLRATSLLFDLFEESLDLSWHLIREYYRQPQLITDPHLADLINQTLNQNWIDALWSLVKIAARDGDPPWWRQLIPVIRQKAIGLVTPPPYEIYQTLLERVKSQHNQSKTASSMFINRQDWRKQGKAHGESPFNYNILDSWSEESVFPHHLRIQLKESYAVGKNAIRELLQTWVDLNWEELEQKFKLLLSWDPDRWELLSLAEEIDSFQIWLEKLYQGPGSGTSVREFLQSMQNAKPPIDEVLGKPPWLLSLNKMLSYLLDRTGPKPPLNTLKNWCPWILNYPETLNTDKSKTVNDSTISTTLTHFTNHLRSWSDIDVGLQAVRKDAPGFHPVCKNLTDGFSKVLSLNFDPEPLAPLCTTPPHPALDEACQALKLLITWRTSLSQVNLEEVEKEICSSTLINWQIIQHACEITTRWNEEIIPNLQMILEEKIETSKIDATSNKGVLFDIINLMETTKHTWSKIYNNGVHLRWLENLEEAIEAGRTLFLDWRNRHEHSDDPFERIFYHCQLDLIRKISSRLLKLSQHIRLTKLRFTELGKANQVWAYRLKKMTGIFTHLEAIETELVQDASERQLPGWQSMVDQIRDTSSPEARRKVVLSLPANHPLYTWLVDSIF